jgi:hypothetical protein
LSSGGQLVKGQRKTTILPACSLSVKFKWRWLINE